VKCDPSSNSRVWTDPDLWERVVFNLISNAFKYTMSGQITVVAKMYDSHFMFSVTDTGCGIPEDQLPLIFDRCVLQ
jgi:signal transduction histidine kinase